MPPLRGLAAWGVSIDITPLRGCESVPLRLFFCELRLSKELREKIREALKIRHEPNRNCPNYSKIKQLFCPSRASLYNVSISIKLRFLNTNEENTLDRII